MPQQQQQSVTGSTLTLPQAASVTIGAVTDSAMLIASLMAEVVPMLTLQSAQDTLNRPGGIAASSVICIATLLNTNLRAQARLCLLVGHARNKTAGGCQGFQ